MQKSVVASRAVRNVAILLACAFVAACGAGGGMADPVPTGSVSEPPANRAPTISGNGGATLTVGQAYSFTPTAADADGNGLTFSISGKPGWTTFSASTGALSGTPAAADVGTSNVTITVSDGAASATLTFAITVNAAAVSNRAPQITGNGSASIVAGQAYSFTPTASDADGNALTFSIAGLPAWLAFNSTTGALTGTPTAANAGTYAMTITVSDGALSAALAVTVTVTAPADKSATLSWSAPTQRTDGSMLSNLAGYRIYYGTNPGNLASTLAVTNSSVTTAVVDGLTAGTWYFAATAVDAGGVESARTATVSIALN